MDVIVLLGVFFLLLFLGVPIGISLVLSSLVYVKLFMNVPPIIIGQQMLKGVDSFSLLAIPFFIIAGALMESGGISKRIVAFAKALVGHLTGGLAIVTIIASMIFAAMTGAGAATTAAVGGIMIPSMIEEGYEDGYAGAIQSTAGIFGPLIPPSVLMVLYGVASGASVGDMLLAGLIPGLFLGVLLISVVVYQCKKKGYTGVGSFSFKTVAKAFVDAFWALLAPIIILGGIYSGLFTPTEASAIACFYSIIIGLFVYNELNIETLLSTIYKALKTAAGIMLIVSATQAFGWVLTRAGIPQMVASAFISLTSSSYVFLIIVMFILLIAGCFIDAVPALLIFAPILLPSALEFGVDIVHFGVVMVMVLCVGLVTPPVGVNLFVASSVGNVPLRKMFKHLTVLLLTILAGVIIVIFVPQISLILPSLMK